MADEIELWTNPQSRGVIAEWMLEETGRPYRKTVLDFGEEMKAPGYLAINPMGKIPAIRWQRQVVTEAAAICAFLAETFPEAGLAPRPEERASYHRWMFFGAGPVEAAVSNHALGLKVPRGRERTVGYGSFEDVVAALDGVLSAQAWFAGGRFTAVDVYTGSQIAWGLRFGTLPALPSFTGYVARLGARPAFQRTMGD